MTAEGPAAAVIVAGGTYGEREAAALALLQAAGGAGACDGTSACDRTSAFDGAYASDGACAAVLEGLPDGRDLLGAAFGHLPEKQRPRIARLPPGCPCCAGNLVIRVTLNRLLRPRPALLVIAIADPAHAPALRDFLSQEPYGPLLALRGDVIL